MAQDSKNIYWAIDCLSYQRWLGNTSVVKTSFLSSVRNILPGCFKLIAPNSFRIHYPRRFLRDRPWKIPQVFNLPLPSPLRMFFLFFSPDVWVFVLFGYLGLKGSHTSSKKKQRTSKSSAVQKFRVYKKRRGLVDVCAVKCKNHGLAS